MTHSTSLDFPKYNLYMLEHPHTNLFCYTYDIFASPNPAEEAFLSSYKCSNLLSNFILRCWAYELSLVNHYTIQCVEKQIAEHSSTLPKHPKLFHYNITITRGGQWVGLSGFGFKVVTQVKSQSQKIRHNLPIKLRLIFSGLRFKWVIGRFDSVRNKKIKQ
jgi:hypothetical protein